MTTRNSVTQKSLPSVELGLAVLGAVCGTVITNLLETSDTTRFVGIALGAAIPPFVNAVGSWRPIRATAAVLIAIVAFCSTYVGGGAVSVVTGTEVVPLPPQLVATPTKVFKTGIGVTPSKLTCTPVCDSEVVLKNTGTAPLLVDGVEFDGPAKKLFGYEGTCAQREIDPGESCSLAVRFTPAGAVGKQAAQLTVHHNAAAGKTVVDLSGNGIPTKPDLAVSAANATCQYMPAGMVGGKDSVQVFFSLLMTGGTPSSVPKQVPIAARKNGSVTSNFSTPVSFNSSTAVVAALPVGAGDYGHSHAITIAVDPGAKIAESNDKNNQFKVRLTLPAKPSPPKKMVVTCVDS